jgi:hypothetical protein
MPPLTGLTGDLQTVVTALQALTIKLGDLIQQITLVNAQMYLPRSGGTMTGPLILAGDPTDPLGAATKQYVDAQLAVHYARVRTANNALNSGLASGAVLQFDTVTFDTDGFAPGTSPFNALTIPAGLGGVYIINGWSSGSANQSTTLGMGVLVSGSAVFSGTNQSISGPASVNYTLDNGAVVILQLTAGATIQLVNNSIAPSSAFSAVTLSVCRLGV